MKVFLLALFVSSALAEPPIDQEFGPKDDPREWRLSEAIRDDVRATVEALIESGVSINDEPTKRNGYRHRNNPICTAATHGRTAIAAILLKAGADPNSTASSGESALWLAAHGGHLETVKLLLASGARVNGSPVLSQTPMDALNDRIKHFEVIKAIIEQDGGVTSQQLRNRKNPESGPGE